MERVKNVIALMGILLAFAGSSFGISYVQEIQIPAYQTTEVMPGFFSTEDTEYYHTDNGQYFQLKTAMSGSENLQITDGLVKLWGETGYNYRFNGTLTVGPSNFIQNKTNTYWDGHPGEACGEFEGGFTMSIVGDLWNINDPGTLLADDEVIFMATNNQTTWDLYEFDVHTPPSYNDVVASPTFDTGICYLNGPNMDMPETFQANFSFDDSQSGTSGDVTDFGTTGSYIAPLPVIEISVVPEPTSLVLLAASAGMCIFRRRTK